MKILFILMRWLLAAGCLWGGWRMVEKGANSGPMGAFLFLIAIGMLIAAVLLISPETVGSIAGWFGDRFTGFIYPDHRSGKPVLSYTLARHYRRLHRAAEAIEEYRKIIRYYPPEKDAYIELLTLALHEGEDRIYKKYARKARRLFRCEIEIVPPPPLLPQEETPP